MMSVMTILRQLPLAWRFAGLFEVVILTVFAEVLPVRVIAPSLLITPIPESVLE
jgi:hypothetical protein